MKKILAVLIAILLIGTYLYYRAKPLHPTVMINGTTFVVDLAITSNEWTKGLSGRTNLLPNHGMLFIRDHKEQYSFWMKDMNFPLDFIWLDGNVIVDVTKNVPPLSNGQIPIIKPVKPVDKILEINAGEIDKAGIKIGDTALFNK